MESKPAVVIAGMHRSGTSLLTSFLEAMGLDVGTELLAADANNRRGYFEDERFLALNRRILSECTRHDDGGHPDWGWTENDSLDRSRLAAYREDAERLVRELGPRDAAWGFKDPRSALLLDFWDSVLEEARFVLVYRSPWDVADSMQRLGADVFLRRPEFAPRIWRYYNEQLLDFYRRHSDRCLLLSTSGYLNGPQELGRLAREKLALDLDLEPTGLESVFDDSMLAELPADDPLIKLTAATSPEVLETLRQLEDVADLPSNGLWRSTADPSSFTVGSLEWVPPEQPPREAGEEDSGEAGPVTGEAPENSLPGASAAESSSFARLAVVIPCRDHGQFLVEAIASVERSLEIPYELIIIDDGSTDERTLVFMATLRACGYRVITQEPSGLSAARNRGISLAWAPFVVPLDADNRLRPGPFLVDALAALTSDEELGVVYGDCEEFGLRRGRRVTAEFDLEKTLRGNYIDACAVVRKAMWLDAGGYDKDLAVWEDWEFWIRVARRDWKFRRLDLVAFDYRVRPGSLVSMIERPEILARVMDHVVRRHRGVFEEHMKKRLGPALSAWTFLVEKERDRLRELMLAQQADALDSPPASSAAVSTTESPSPGPEVPLSLQARLEVQQARVSVLEAQHEADRFRWRLEQAVQDSARFEEAAAHLQDSLTARDEVVRLQEAALGAREAELERASAWSHDLERRTAEAERRAAEVEERAALAEQGALETHRATAELAAWAEQLERDLVSSGERLGMQATREAELVESHRRELERAQAGEARAEEAHRRAESLEQRCRAAEARANAAEARAEHAESGRVELRRILDQIEGSRAHSLVRWWWRLRGSSG